MKRTYLYRMYPSKSQRGGWGPAATCRHSTTPALRERKDAYELPASRHQDRPVAQGLGREGHQSLRPGHPQPHPPNVVADLDKAFQASFRRVKAGESRLSPVQGQEPLAGFGFKEYGNGFKVDGYRLGLSGIGRIALRWHREVEGNIKTARVFRRTGKWFVAFPCEVEKPEPLPKTGESIGIDLGRPRLATFSNGEKKQNPRWYRRIFGNSVSCNGNRPMCHG